MSAMCFRELTVAASQYTWRLPSHSGAESLNELETVRGSGRPVTLAQDLLESVERSQCCGKMGGTAVFVVPEFLDSWAIFLYPKRSVERMKRIQIADVTLHEEAMNPHISLSFKEKIELAKELDKMGVDVIETAAIGDCKSEALLVRTISTLVKKSTISCPTGLTVTSVEETWKNVQNAVSPRLLISVPVSTVQMEYICHRKAPKMLELITDLVSAAAGHCDNVEFAAEDATRADHSFLCDAINTAISHGAKTITICDTAGTMMPEEFISFLETLYQDIPALATVTLAVRTCDELGMAVASAFACVRAGVMQIDVAASGSPCAALDAVAHVFHNRGDSIGIFCGLDMTSLNRAMKRLGWISRNDDGKTAGDLSGTMLDETLLLDSTTDISTVAAALARQGYELSDEDLALVYEAFCRIAAKKPVGAKELDAIVASTAMQVPPAYTLTSYVINSGNVISATAQIALEKNGTQIRGLSVGDGPIDAAFLAIEQAVGHHYELDDFQIQAVTEGREAMGSALIKLRSNGRLFSGQGISTDIIDASILAYLDALNKIVYEENIG